LKLANRKDREGKKVDHPDYNPRTIFIPADVMRAQTPAMKQWFEIKQDYFDTVLFFKV
jgi:DNA mismatch repair protein MSH6